MLVFYFCLQAEDEWTFYDSLGIYLSTILKRGHVEKWQLYQNKENFDNDRKYEISLAENIVTRTMTVANTVKI